VHQTRGSKYRLRVTLFIIPKACMNPYYFIVHSLLSRLVYYSGESEDQGARGEKVSGLCERQRAEA